MQLEILEDWLTASNVREEIEMLQAVFCWLALYHTLVICTCMVRICVLNLSCVRIVKSAKSV